MRIFINKRTKEVCKLSTECFDLRYYDEAVVIPLKQWDQMVLELAALRDQRDNLLGIVDALEDREMGAFDPPPEDSD